MELYCCEQEMPRRAYRDPVFLKDKRVLQNMLRLEDKYLASANYITCVQTDIKPHMRKMVTQWMLEVCEEQRCEEEVFSLAVNYMDRFLSCIAVGRSRLQLLATACMFLASKLKQTTQMQAESLILYTDNSISLQDLLDWELFVLCKLKWDLASITPHDLLDLLLHRLSIADDLAAKVRRHAVTYISLCALEYDFVMHPPSMVACGSLLVAARGLTDSTTVRKMLRTLMEITKIDEDCMRSCQEQIELAARRSLTGSSAAGAGSNGTTAAAAPGAKQAVNDSSDSAGGGSSASTAGGGAAASSAMPRATPTDTRDVKL